MGDNLILKDKLLVVEADTETLEQADQSTMVKRMHVLLNQPLS